MFHSRQLNKIKRLHLRALRLVYDDYNEASDKALQRHRSCTIHQNNRQQLVLEILYGLVNIVKYSLAASEVLETMVFMSNNSIQMSSNFDFCASKFDNNCAQNLISEFFSKNIQQDI